MNLKDVFHGRRLPLAAALLLTLLALGTPSATMAGHAEHATVSTQKTRLITGVVLDQNNEPVIGASVLVKDNPSTGVATDIDGKFTLNVPDEYKTLLITYIGYKDREVYIGTATAPLSIRLVEDSKMLQEVQIIAYGTQTKVSVTGAMNSIDTEELLKVPSASVTNALAGSLPGVTAVQTIGQPGKEDAALYIRGSSSLDGSGSDAPLVLVDGIERPFSQIDPNEIDDITVLKDAASTAVFGVRGANGVILVTTRRGKKGQAKISVSSNISIQMPTRLIDACDSYNTALLYNEKLDNDNSNKSHFSDYALRAYRTGSDPQIYPNTNWREMIFRDAYIQSQHNINISGGTDRVRYFTSLGYLYQDGLIKDFATLDYDNQFSYNRFNYRANLDIDITKSTLLKLNIGGRVGITHEPRGHDDGFWRQVNWATPFSSPGLSPDGYITMVAEDYLPIQGKVGLDAFYGRGYNQTLKNDMNMDVALEQKLDMLTKGLKVYVKGSYNTYYTSDIQRSGNLQRKVLYYEGTKTQPGMDIEDPAFNKNIISEIRGEDKPLTYNESFSKKRDWYIEAGLTYNHTFNQRHKISALVLYNQNRVYYPQGFASYIPRSYVGLVGRVSYGYDNRYLLDVNMGYNGSENFAKGSTRFGLFPSVSVGWVLSEEKFMKRQQTISFLKLRVSYGVVGNDKISNDRFLYIDGVWSMDNDGYNFGTDITSKEPSANEGKLGNPMVTWEKSYKQNYGIDMKLFNDRLSFTADYFNEKRTDILISRKTTPDIVAVTLPRLNMGEVHNNGYELSLKWADRRHNWRYWISANASFARNKIIYMDEVKHTNDFNNQTGHSTGLTYGYVFDRFYNEADFNDKGHLTAGQPTLSFGTPRPGDCKYVDLDNNGIIDSNDRAWLGYSTLRPEYVFGIEYGLQWKGLSFSMQWTGATHVSRNLSQEYRIPFSPSGNRALFTYHAANRWTPETAATATMPRFSDTSKAINYDVNSTLWLKDASYLRLKNIQVGYTFSDKRWLRAVGLSTFNIYLSGYNLLTIDGLDFIDPEASTQGGKSNQYPIPKIITLGVKLNF